MKIFYYATNEENGESIDIDATTLEGHSFEGMNLRRIDLRGAALNGASFKGAELRGAYLMDAEATNTNFRSSSLIMADLRRANLRGAILRCWLLYARFDHADLSGADFTYAEVGDTSFAGCDLRGAVMLAYHLDDAIFTGARFDRHTVWPEGFRPLDKGAIEVEEHREIDLVMPETSEDRNKVMADITSQKRVVYKYQPGATPPISVIT